MLSGHISSLSIGFVVFVLWFLLLCVVSCIHISVFFVVISFIILFAIFVIVCCFLYFRYFFFGIAMDCLLLSRESIRNNPLYREVGLRAEYSLPSQTPICETILGILLMYFLMFTEL